ncbi:hypothetical protein [Achromobacter aegrifaciens]|uniref:hypothetical protein n=1 Tax=Achromobacter aegrifaciens TaxID=1287736 RepID=UPI001583A76A|nr:hypothetical protein [Achromobacter aegrifaciens]
MPNQEFLEALLDILAPILNVLDSNGDLKDLPNLPDHRGGLGKQAGDDRASGLLSESHHHTHRADPHANEQM